MTRKFAAALLVLALASCFGRVSAWAAAPGDAHACCRGESKPLQETSLSDCCPTPAVGGAVSVVRGELLAILVELPKLPTAFAVHEAAAAFAAPPGPLALRPAVPARAPPLA